MNYLFYFSTCFNTTFLGALLDEAITLSKSSNNKVHFVYCDGVSEMCIFNTGGSKSLCKFCSSSTKRVIRQYKIEAMSLYDFYCDSGTKIDYRTSEELRKIEYRGVQLGLGIISNYITRTRNLAPAINASSKPYFDAHVAQGVRVVDTIYKMIDVIKPDVVYTFNPRFEEYRPIFDICKMINLNCQIVEAVKKDGTWRKVIYDNHLPHDIFKRKERREYCWSHYPMDESDKIKLGESFYRKRRGGQESGDVKIYVANQKEGDAPDFDESKRNIAIMNSSEDEFAAVGGDWDKLKLFKTQYEGIIYMLENLDEQFHFYLRVHPNLSNIPYKYHTDLYKLEQKYPNITVIPATSNMSTYTIMEKCEKVVCFGSTMGIESSFWGKVAILLGPSYYYYDDVVYVPKTKDEVLWMLRADLKAKHNIDIIKYGAYTLDNTPLHLPMTNINYNPSYRKLFDLKFTTNSFINFMGGEYLTGLYIAIMRYIKQRNSKFSLPKEEE